MGVATAAKVFVNRILRQLNMRVDSLTADRLELGRLAKLVKRKHFETAQFPALPAITNAKCDQIFLELRNTAQRFHQLVNGQSAFNLDNDYYTTPDAEVLYSVVLLHGPNRIVEIGSGYSTQLFRIAINDAGLKTHLTSIDPHPRTDISRYADDVIRDRVEDLEDVALFRKLGANDVLFVDSSHEIKPGNDLLHIVFDILPILAPGVIIHFHDIFLPYDYPKEWIIKNRWNWTEQYLLQAYLTHNQEYDVIWPGHYLQRTRGNFDSYFSNIRDRTAKSFWMIKR